MPLKTGRIKYRAVETNAAVVPTAFCTHTRDAAETDANAAGHWRFQRQMTRHLPLCGDRGKRPHHRFGTAAHQVLDGAMRFQEVGDKSVKSEGAIIAGQVKRRSGLAKILNAG